MEYKLKDKKLDSPSLSHVINLTDASARKYEGNTMRLGSVCMGQLMAHITTRTTMKSILGSSISSWTATDSQTGFFLTCGLM